MAASFFHFPYDPLYPLRVFERIVEKERDFRNMPQVQAFCKASPDKAGGAVEPLGALLLVSSRAYLAEIDLCLLEVRGEVDFCYGDEPYPRVLYRAVQDHGGYLLLNEVAYTFGTPTAHLLASLKGDQKTVSRFIRTAPAGWLERAIREEPAKNSLSLWSSP